MTRSAPCLASDGQWLRLGIGLSFFFPFGPPEGENGEEQIPRSAARACSLLTRREGHMDRLTILAYSVTTLGICLSVLSMVFIFRGQPIPGDRGLPQVLKYKGPELRTNAVIMLLIISLVVAGGPFTLLLRHERTAHDPTLLRIVGRIDDESGRGLQGATVTLTYPDNRDETKSVEADGAFDFTVKLTQFETGIPLRADPPTSVCCYQIRQMHPNSGSRLAGVDTPPPRRGGRQGRSRIMLSEPNDRPAPQTVPQESLTWPAFGVAERNGSSIFATPPGSGGG
jgi:hypothetical protein